MQGSTRQAAILNETFTGIETEEWHIKNVAERRAKQLEMIGSLGIPENGRILDVGGSSYYRHFKQTSITYEMIDIATSNPYGKGGGHNIHPEGKVFDGKNLPYTQSSFDLVILSYCLHHASQYSLGILIQSINISKTYLLIAEDLTGIDYPKKWLERNFKHEPGGVYRSQLEWEQLFQLMGCALVKRVGIRRQDDVDHLRFYRMNWIIKKNT